MKERPAGKPDPDVNVYRPDRPGIRKVLGDLEAEIMELVWSRPPGDGTTVRDVFEVLYQRRRSAYTTVMSTMARLARKNLLRVVKADHAYVYYANFTQDEFVSRFVGRILEDLLVGFTGSTLDNIDKLSGTEGAARVQRLLDEVIRRREAEERG